MEKKSVSFELKDFSPGQRTAVIAHSVYNSIDRSGDIARKGMFNKSWKELPVEFWFNHKDDQVPGKVIRTFEDEEKAYTEVKFGNYTLGSDVMEMADMGVLKGASFGYVTEKKNWVNIKGKKVRELKEVWHIETSLLTKLPMHPDAGIVSLNKSTEGILLELKAHIETMEKYIRNAKGSDDSITKIIDDLVEAKSIIDKYDTADTQLAIEQPASVEEQKDASAEVLTRINLLTLSI